VKGFGIMRILIAEDDLAGRKILQKYLSKYGECDIAVDGIEALDLFLAAIKEEKPYDLVCLDIMMPKLDGLKVLKAIRDIEKQKEIDENSKSKIVMTTALNDKKTVMQAYDSGCEAYAWKPIDLAKLKEVLLKFGLINE
jgi:two-component system chemotaxis response regulator CheY